MTDYQLARSIMHPVLYLYIIHIFLHTEYCVNNEKFKVTVGMKQAACQHEIEHLQNVHQIIITLQCAHTD